MNIDQSTVDMIANEVMQRLRQRRIANRKWWAMFVVALIGVAGTLNWAVVSSFDRDTVKDAARLRSTPTAIEGVDSFSGPFEQTITIERDDSEIFRIVGVQGTRVITANAEGDFDPIIDLYRIDSGGASNLIASDDDGNGDLNSRIIAILNRADTYELQVRELFGDPGSVTVSLDDDEQ